MFVKLTAIFTSYNILCLVFSLTNHVVCEQKVEVNDTQSRPKKEEPVVESPEESETEVNTHNTHVDKVIQKCLMSC